VPAVSAAIFAGNAKLAPGDVWINLAGLAIGNGLTNPLEQYAWYANMAYNQSIAELGKPAITLRDYEGMVAAWPACQARIADCQTDTSACAGAQSSCDNAMFGPYENTGLDVYDISKPCGPNPLCAWRADGG